MNVTLRQSCFGACVLLGLTVLLAGSASAESHKNFSGNDVKVHYVRLTGHHGDNEEKRNELRTTHSNCARLNSVINRPVTPLPSLPEVPNTSDIEIYYSANRTLTNKKGKTWNIDPDNCALTPYESHFIDLRSGAGSCEINMKERTAKGQCDKTKHRLARTATYRGPEPQSGQVGLDPAVPGSREAALPATDPLGRATGIRKGPVKTIAGYSCEVTKLLTNEKCVANPPSDFVIPPAAFNLERGGLLLELVSPILTIRAQEVTMNMMVSDDLFSVPAGVQIREIPLPGERGR